MSDSHTCGRQVCEVSKRFKRALEHAGLPPTTRVHDLRHDMETMLLERRETVPTVSEQLGHAGLVTTMRIYMHSVPGALTLVAEGIDSITRRA